MSHMVEEIKTEHGQVVRATDWMTAITVLVLLLNILSHCTTIDHDLYHEMALARDAWQKGYLPTEELFAFTPTVPKVVHHEWGSGVIFYAVAMGGGAAGLMALKYALVGLLAILVIAIVRKRGAQVRMICLVALPGMLLLTVGLATIRAQMFTLCFMALLLLFLEKDRNGKRWWIIPWLALYVVWENLHGGFLVGIGLLGLYWIEQVIRTRRVQWHLLTVTVAMGGLIFVNPYGLDYPRYLWHAMTMPRPGITDWLPIWKMHPPLVLTYGLALIVFIYTICRMGLKKMEGVLILGVCMILAARHLRHVSLLAVAWMCYMPGWLEGTPLGELFNATWTKHRGKVQIACVLISLPMLGVAIYYRPFTLVIPTAPPTEDRNLLVYAVGAVDYLKQQKFHGNVMTPFASSSYVSWELYPAVKVGMDSRYEVAYQQGLPEEIWEFYYARAGWEKTLNKYSSDLVLVPTWQALCKKMEGQKEWALVYQDDAYQLYAKPGLKMPVVDRRGETIVGKFP